ncbi:MAG: lytic murein transglycosylase [Rickettsiales bacterium]|jgi:membrane-bound lytic murein transglycosylase B|nr:lytic murein transglycosylase [Rickettsiales bacterium]
MVFLYFCIFFVGALAEGKEVIYAGEPGALPTFEIWKENFKKEAREKYSIRQDVLDIAFKDVRENEKIIHLDRNQPETQKTFLDYYGSIVNKSRIERGRNQLKQYEKILNKATQRYGVPPYLIVAFWDMETHFGKNMGRSYIINVLSNLVFDGRRKTLFTKELIHALQIIQKKQIKIENFKGSWAGAFGNFQFMPSTFVNYAVDGDKDGKIDLYNSIPDAVFSAANYLSKMGWNSKYRWGRPVNFDVNNEKLWSLANSKEWRDLSFFINNGVKSYNGKSIQNAKNLKAKIVAPMGKEGPLFLVYENFRVIMRWNNSTKYALSIGLLSDAYLYGETLK